MPKAPKPLKDVAALTHDEARRANVPTAEMASLYEQQEEILGSPEQRMTVERSLLKPGETRPRDADRDPQIVWNGARISLTPKQIEELTRTGTVEIGDAQLVWRGKDSQDWSDLVVNAPPLYIQEKIHPKAIIDDLKRRSGARREASAEAPDLFADFNGLDDPEARTEFYQHSQHWSNRMILGDSLQVMASLAEREAMKGKVQCIYFDPPYGIKFNSNWQVSTQSRDVKDGKREDLSREPEQVKAFRDTWKDGIHSYLTYLRDRLSVARELLTESGSIFVQIGDENVHRVRAVMDEVFGEENLIASIAFRKTGAFDTNYLQSNSDYILWFSKRSKDVKFRSVPEFRTFHQRDLMFFDTIEVSPFDRRPINLISECDASEIIKIGQPISRNPLNSDGWITSLGYTFIHDGDSYDVPKNRHWTTTLTNMSRLQKANRLIRKGNTLRYARYWSDYVTQKRNNVWLDTGVGGFVGDDRTYVVQTDRKVIERCILMATDPGDLVLDPTCGSGTTATVAEQWGRRWITIDTSRVALALARTRLMSARYPYYLLADSAEGRDKEQKVSGKIQPQGATGGDVRQGFVYERAPHVTLKSIANNAEIDVIYERWQETLEPLRAELNAALGRVDPSPSKGEGGPAQAGSGGDRAGSRSTPEEAPTRPVAPATGHPPHASHEEGSGALPFEDWQISRTAGAGWPEAARVAHEKWWEGRIARQKEIDASIARAADVELLYDRPYEDKTRVRVAGPFTVESLSPHRVVTARDDTLAEDLGIVAPREQRGPKNVPDADFGRMVLDNLRTTGVHQHEKGDSIRFASLDPWPGGRYVAADGRYTDGDGREKRAAILIGPEFGTLSRSDITAAAREASEARFDALIACAFNFDAQASDLTRLGPLPILKARMNPDLHMAADLKNTGKGNLFVVFGEPDIELMETSSGEIQVKVKGVDVFDPATGDIRSDGVEGIAAWFIDDDYNEESFFVRHAYFLGANDPYKSLKTALRAEVDEEAWATLNSDVSRPFPRPATGRISVKVINHFGDEVLKVFGV